MNNITECRAMIESMQSRITQLLSTIHINTRGLHGWVGGQFGGYANSLIRHFNNEIRRIDGDERMSISSTTTYLNNILRGAELYGRAKACNTNIKNLNSIIKECNDLYATLFKGTNEFTTSYQEALEALREARQEALNSNDFQENIALMNDLYDEDIHSYSELGEREEESFKKNINMFVMDKISSSEDIARIDASIEQLKALRSTYFSLKAKLASERQAIIRSIQTLKSRRADLKNEAYSVFSDCSNSVEHLRDSSVISLYFALSTIDCVVSELTGEFPSISSKRFFVRKATGILRRSLNNAVFENEEGEQ